MHLCKPSQILFGTRWGINKTENILINVMPNPPLLDSELW